ncbi:TMEM43 family protein [Myxococcota bacterium]|nr:TMEM43 family protein [Myxococcota bacterium]
MDNYTETSHESWFSRIGDSIKGIFIGFILILISIPVLWFNEGRTVERYRSLKEGASAVISVQSDQIDPKNENKLIHTTGTAQTTEWLNDPELGVTAQGLKMDRKVEMYQWEEKKKKKEKKELGGGKTTETTYTYTKVWDHEFISSAHFKVKDGHQNPASMPFKSKMFTSTKAKLGAFSLSSSEINGIKTKEPVSLADKRFDHLNRPYHLLDSNTLYLGQDPNLPVIGDMKITFTAQASTPMSIVGLQRNGGFTAYLPKSGSSILLIEEQLYSADQMFKSAQQENTLIAWLLRLLGFGLMFVGLIAIMNPLAVLADVIPFLGSLVSFGAGIFAFIGALTLSLTVIAIAWIFYRPLLAGGLILVAVAAVAVPAWLKHQQNA